MVMKGSKPYIYKIKKEMVKVPGGRKQYNITFLNNFQALFCIHFYIP